MVGANEEDGMCTWVLLADAIAELGSFGARSSDSNEGTETVTAAEAPREPGRTSAR